MQAWAQLHLHTSLPSGATSNDKVVTINISNRENCVSSETKERHRVLWSVPPADVRPIQGIQRYDLELIRFSLELLESKTKKRPRLKRSKTSPVEGRHPESQNDSGVDSDDESEAMLHEMVATAHSGSFGELCEVSGHPTATGKRKRATSRTQAAMRVKSLPVRQTQQTTNPLNRSIKTTISQDRLQTPFPINELEEVKRLVDGAMRLSIYGVNKTNTGLKIKANTFAVGLADVAPALWRPGYLTVGATDLCPWRNTNKYQALSQRANLLPTISRSMNQIERNRVVSVSLSEKLGKLTTLPTTKPQQRHDVDDESLSDISKHLWQHLQRSLLTRPSAPVQEFMACGSEAVIQSDSDDNLHEFATDIFTTSDGFMVNDAAQSLADTHTTQRENTSPLSQTQRISSASDQNLGPELTGILGINREASAEIPSATAVRFLHHDPTELFDADQHEYRSGIRRVSDNLAVSSSVECKPADYTATVRSVEGQSPQMHQTALDDVANVRQLSKENLLFHEFGHDYESGVQGHVSLEDTTNGVLPEASEELLELF